MCSTRRRAIRGWDLVADRMTAAHIEYPDRTNLLGRQLPNIWHVGNRLLHNQCGNDIERSNPIRMLIVRAKPSDGHVQLPAVSYRKLERIIKESVYCQRLRLEENVTIVCDTYCSACTLVQHQSSDHCDTIDSASRPHCNRADMSM